MKENAPNAGTRGGDGTAQDARSHDGHVDSIDNNDPLLTMASNSVEGAEESNAAPDLECGMQAAAVIKEEDVEKDAALTVTQRLQQFKDDLTLQKQLSQRLQQLEDLTLQKQLSQAHGGGGAVSVTGSSQVGATAAGAPSTWTEENTLNERLQQVEDLAVKNHLVGSQDSSGVVDAHCLPSPSTTLTETSTRQRMQHATMQKHFPGAQDSVLDTSTTRKMPDNSTASSTQNSRARQRLQELEDSIRLKQFTGSQDSGAGTAFTVPAALERLEALTLEKQAHGAATRATDNNEDIVSSNVAHDLSAFEEVVSTNMGRGAVNDLSSEEFVGAFRMGGEASTQVYEEKTSDKSFNSDIEEGPARLEPQELVEAELVPPPDLGNNNGDDDPIILVSAKEDHSEEHAVRMRRGLVVAIVLLVAAVSACVVVVVVNNREPGSLTDANNPSLSNSSQSSNDSAIYNPTTLPPQPEFGWVQRGEGIMGTNDAYGEGESVALSNDGSALAIGGAAVRSDGGAYQGHIRVLDWNASSKSWKQRGDLIEGQYENAYVGSKDMMALSGDGMILASSELGPTYGVGRTQIFEWTVDDVENISEKKGFWKQKGQSIDGENTGTQSGKGLALSDDGNVVAIGALDLYDRLNKSAFPHTAAGRIRVYHWNQDSQSWTQRGDDIKGRTDFDGVGWVSSLASNGSVLAVSAMFWGGSYENPMGGGGQVRVYEWNETHWNQIGNDLSGEDPGGGYGKHLALSSDGHMVAIGSMENPLVEVFRRDSTGVNWTQMGQSIKTDYTQRPHTSIQGLALALSSSFSSSLRNGRTRLVICYTRHARMYEWNSSTVKWDPVGQELVAEEDYSENGDIAMSRNGEVIAIGMPDGTALESGPTKIYEWRDPPADK